MLVEQNQIFVLNFNGPLYYTATNKTLSRCVHFSPLTQPREIKRIVMKMSGVVLGNYKTTPEVG